MIICLEVPEIAENLKNILRDRELQKSLGRAGRKYVIENFGIDAATEMTIRAYRKVLSRRKYGMKYCEEG
jgi:glycosyltransferase involved in cell wall biosynthesis